MSRTHWLIGVAVLLSLAAPAMSQDENAAGFERPFLIGEPLLPSQYWLGINCSAVPPMLQSHLHTPDSQGVLVVSVVPNSPAAKAGLVQYDVLLKAGGKPLTNPRELMVIVDATKENKLKIELIRSGKPQTLELTPAKRPAGATAADPQPDQADLDIVQQWLENVRPGQQGPFTLNMIRPGVIVPKDVLVGKPLPGNMTVVITKTGDQPAKINVTRDKDNWDITEKQLDKLPADVRPHVDQLLGRNVQGFIAGSIAGQPTFQNPIQMPMPRIQPLPGIDPRIEKRFEEMNRRMDKLMQLMEKMMDDRQPAASNHDHTHDHEAK